MAIGQQLGILGRTVIVLLGMVIAGAAYGDPHSDGLALGKGQLDTLNGNVNTEKAKGTPFYTIDPPQKANYGAASLFEVGAGRITSCKSATHGSDAVANQECDAVNFLAKNPENKVKVEVGNNDPIIKGTTDIINGANGSAVDTGCIDKTTTTPDETRLDTCNIYNVAIKDQCTMGQVVEVDADANYLCDVTHNARNRYTCHRGALPTFAQTPVENSYTVNPGNEVPPWSIRTFDLNLVLDGNPIHFALDYYEVDNFGQLWVNGTKVYDSSAWGGDLRYSYLGTGNILFNRDGVNLGQFYDPGCSGPCKGVYPAADITPYLQNGNNNIQLVCMNANTYGPCKISISGTSGRPYVIGSVIDNGCASFQARSQ